MLEFLMDMTLVKLGLIIGGLLLLSAYGLFALVCYRRNKSYDAYVARRKQKLIEMMEPQALWTWREPRVVPQSCESLEEAIKSALADSPFLEFTEFENIGRSEITRPLKLREFLLSSRFEREADDIIANAASVAAKCADQEIRRLKDRIKLLEQAVHPFAQYCADIPSKFADDDAVNIEIPLTSEHQEIYLGGVKAKSLDVSLDGICVRDLRRLRRVMQ